MSSYAIDFIGILECSCFHDGMGWITYIYICDWILENLANCQWILLQLIAVFIAKQIFLYNKYDSSVNTQHAKCERSKVT